MKKNKIENKEDFTKYIESKLEELNVSTGDNLQDNKLEVIRTGSLSLDISTGIGGIPRGKSTELFGAEATGKTTLALSIANQALKDGLKVLYIDAENTLFLDRVLSVVTNYDPELFTLMQPYKMEDSLFIAEEGIRSGSFGLVILDSIGSLAPKKVFEDDLDDANVALLARLLTTFVQRNAFEIREKKTAFVGINQVRDKIGSYMGGYETPGGHSWKHHCSLRIFLSKLADIKVGDNDPIGITTKFVVRKNKIAPPMRSFTFSIMFDKGVDIERDVVEFGIMLGVIDKRSGYYVFEDKTIGHGMLDACEFLHENQETLDKIINLCYNKVNIIKEEKGSMDE